jgi:hypothetical protein
VFLLKIKTTHNNTKYTTMTSLQTSSKQLMETYADMPCYTVYELTTNGLVYTSQFSSKSDAKHFVRRFGMYDSTLYIYKSYCIKTYEPLDEPEQEQEQEEQELESKQNLVCLVDEDYNSDEDPDFLPEDELAYDSTFDLSNMTLTTYGKGYLLTPPEDHECFGDSYFLDGWWLKKHHGWFFKAQFYDNLIASGLSLSCEGCEEECDWCETNVISLSLSHMKIKEYGRGYMLYTNDKDELYGKETLLEVGVWNRRAKGWSFKKEHLDMLKEHGAKYFTEEYINSDDEFSSSPVFLKHGRAWLLKEDERFVYDENKKYFENGWYNATLKGWIFKTADKKAFMSKYQ